STVICSTPAICFFYSFRSGGIALKRVAIFQIRSLRFNFLFLRMSLSRNRFPLSGDRLAFAHVFAPKPVPTFGRQACFCACLCPETSSHFREACFKKPFLRAKVPETPQ